MIDSVGTLNQLVSGVATGELPVAVLDSEVARLGEHLSDIHDESLVAQYGKLELLLAEYTSGHVDTEELMAELRLFAPINVSADAAVGAAARFTTFTSANSRITRQMIGGAPGLSPAAGIRRVEVRA